MQFGFRIGEVSCPTKYFEEASSINFRRSVKYGFGVLGTSVQFKLHNWGLTHLPRFSAEGRKLELDPGVNNKGLPLANAQLSKVD